jgi:glycosyltransferase involved in cell wall biosynthesis
MDFGLVTVARAAQIPAARATIDSARRAGFTGTVHAIVVDLHVDASTIGPEWTNFLRVVPDPTVARQLAPLGLDALSAAVVPSAIVHALRTEASVVYLAPTVHVLAPLDDFATLAGDRLGLVDRPMAGAPDDGMHPDEIDLARGHRFATSIVSATSTALRSLEWWCDTAWSALLAGEAADTALLLDRLALRFGATTAPQPGRFADWYSLGVDQPRDDGAAITVGGHAIVAVDVAGRDPEHPHRLDARQPLPHRVTLSELPTLSALLDARPHLPHADDRPVLGNDLSFDPIMRETYRAHLRDALDQEAQPPPNPYDEPASFVEWLQQSQFPTVPRVSRYLRQVYLSRPDLSRAFPEVPGRDTARFFSWANDHGRDEIPISAQLLPPKQVDERPRSRVRPATTSVNLVGFRDAALGIGDIARRIGTALDAAGIARASVPFARSRHDRDAKFDVRSAPHDINIVCINPDTLASFADYAGESFFNDRYTIGVWFWETAELPPSMAWAFDLVDEVWAASQFVADAIRARAPSRVAVNVVTLPLVAPVVDPDFRLREVGLRDGAIVFVTSWDYLSVADRKNPLGTVEAYRDAFAPHDGAQLLLKGSNAHRRPDDHQRIRHAALGRPDIHLWTEQLASAEHAAVLAAATGVVSLHRSEGLALNLADAIALGVPAIATAYGGNLTFMDPNDTDLVPYELIDVGPGHHPYPSDAQWAEPDYAFAAKCMRQIVEDPNRARARAQQAQRRITEDFRLQRSAASVAELLGAIVQHDAVNSPRSLLRRGFRRPS